ncbi:protein-methionine-sulfoxide reductase catalytic subunit MsrP [Glaciimonas sp. CA11.2]|uniref:protein-methionine-sulfoxide reductase catalytic subunit MsrP n=1 Tax=unclassified Glaciimonas TaxID=2644401 RepID=UPI002AB51925|nr:MULTISPECIES: protein-methionine-sulfoxide reductase catalytic subunit MsrP [unclassified Glaciimonas]MDY7545756.1 protein-methionine-sulfoxide reductase catalytic subunit MsrP [Glaciimonas sp. CA11.2]MEB0011596.1 protein-methionine-sulfoxide reductase catalytic subunit MsrP [Glaciimonas sp. Cout2]MEB0081393.1 protein-methionine-sulfoxide reductase catalytic subunit MsrP [Glaciimonas sp. Gout2]MEB0162170.1 protein-methionine-sulfoxide reductase catalytic subunit MsrP [Glaciimonas sp. CA11.2]
MLIRRSQNIIEIPAASDITPRAIFDSRRSFIRQLAVGSIATGSILELASHEAFAQNSTLPKLAAKRNATYVVTDKATPYKDATTYNNYYEFGTDKADPAQNAGTLKTRPWSVSIEGEVKKPMTLDLDSLMKLAPMEERIYRLRCVEGWSMVIPWIGYSLSALIKKVEPTSNAKYIEFTTLADKKQMPGLSSPVLEWPYVEGLRMDEAMHPLALLTFGMYGEVLPNQNGAPVRMVLPWKYGFKSAKSIVKIRFLKEQPRTAWNLTAANEYGFYSNVNPNVDHPRWSQATERRIGEDGFFTKKRPTLMFNGYNDVASLYTGMDLKKYF